ncbi:MAG: hypothetical protein LQ338_003427 [Usnochroma carphineum]|nr:MAG: hypothetical protein LQ338_003427 [Usnochroma carphineum]
MANPRSLPQFKDLPLQPNDPPHSAWGLYGSHDQLGTLNRLTDDVVADAARDEIKTGSRYVHRYPYKLRYIGVVPSFRRQTFHKSIFQKAPRIVNDDVWTFNTQSSTQSWAKRGIVGRGILLDFHSWRLANNIAYNPFETGSIPLKQLQAVLKTQGTEIRFGDILFIRSGNWIIQHLCLFREKFLILHAGYIDGYNQLPQDQIEQLASVVPPNLSGVEQSEEMLEWIWNNFSAVAGDHPSFECWPTRKEWALHEVLLAGWGMPIGELFDLEELASHCKESDRWSFFVTSEVCNVPGGVAR